MQLYAHNGNVQLVHYNSPAVLMGAIEKYTLMHYTIKLWLQYQIPGVPKKPVILS